ncbi:lysine-epsilon-oxidase maturase LodB [Arcicella lustrica]|uniref:Lysine-epsilon-oxidase maturase LodB n=1 Tax=Arcicella lustrica TaxID=2984196 RepID=A0ABU5SKF4_9BACT|nr:lysine-epsilon-oxidase maturase LodB [Arcicella sp. DC25W]MEA5427709.1 lysine-epsilon-oxidase maturase LodB [Arcicella sp. DC25W]
MPNTVETDVLIVGGGPAGSSTALSLLKYSNLKVMIIEQNDLNSIRVGEQVNASLFDLLQYIGINKSDFEENSLLPGYSSLAAWGSSHISSRHSIFSTQVDSFQLDREHFDLMLLKQASEKGAIVFPRTKCIDFKQTDTAWTIELRHETRGDFTIKSTYLIDASGRQSHVCRKLGIPIEKYDDLVAIGTFLHFKDTKRAIKQEILLETVEDGWWYFAGLPNQEMVVSLFTDSSIVKEKQLQKTENWNELLSNTVHIKKMLVNTSSNAKPWVRNAFSHISNIGAKSNFWAVGDAVASFDPISSMGIGFAISSACHAAKAIIDKANDSNTFLNYQENINAIFKHYLETKTLFYNKENRWNDSSFWKKRN